MFDSADNKNAMQILAGIAGISNKNQPVGVNFSNNVEVDGENLLLNRNNVDPDSKKFLLDNLQQNDQIGATTLVDNCNLATNKNGTILSREL